MNKEQFLSSGLLEQYVLGLTTPEESGEVERYLKKYPELRAEADAMRKGIEQYAMQQSIPSLSTGRRRSNLQDTEGAGADFYPQAAPVGRTSVAWWQPFASATILILGFSTIFLFRQQAKSARAYQALNAEFALFRERCEDEQRRFLEKEHIYALLTDIETQPILLTGTQAAPQASAVIYWNRQSHEACLNPVHLPPPPAGQQYQLWADVDGKMVSLGLIERHHSDLQLIHYIDHAQSLNITVEPLGGSPAPNVSHLLANGNI